MEGLLGGRLALVTGAGSGRRAALSPARCRLTTPALPHSIGARVSMPTTATPQLPKTLRSARCRSASSIPSASRPILRWAAFASASRATTTQPLS